MRNNNISAEEFERLFEEGEKDVLGFFDLSEKEALDQKPKRVNVDIPQWMINSLDRESKRIGITRQSLIKMWLAERLEKQTK